MKKQHKFTYTPIEKNDFLGFEAINLNSSKSSLANVFIDRRNIEVNEQMLFIAFFNYIPNTIIEEDLDCRKANTWFAQNFSADIKDFYFNRKRLKKGKPSEIDDIYYFIYDDLLIHFDTNNSLIRFFYKKTNPAMVEEVIQKLTAFKLRKRNWIKPMISILHVENGKMSLTQLKINKPKLSISDNYNNDFKEVHQTVMKRLRKDNDKGIVLLHGLPGTGKTSYIRYLISSVRKNVIFLPPSLATSITNPDLISILLDNPNSILVIEDAENIVVDRNIEGHSPVAAILNISDGLLSDCLNIQIVCSFNTDLSKIDSALMRKGRLIARYEFKKLEIEKANALSGKLGKQGDFKEPVTLTGVYNQEEQEYNKAKNASIGFSLRNVG